MACNDGGVPYPPTHEEQLDRNVPIPALCAILRTMNPNEYMNTLAKVNWNAAGVSRQEFVDWWKMHQERDRRRQREERENLRNGNLRRQALDKVAKHLSTAERKVLGIKE
jgi:hypothetical protein